MAAPTLDFVWQQGDDFVISMTYKEGPDAQSVVPVDLTGWSVRMDIKTTSGVRLYTFNSQSIQDTDPLTAGDQSDAVTEAVLGSDGTILITVPRSITLPPTGAIYQQMSSPTNPQTIFDYDIFLRSTTDKQKKILKGKVTIERSITLWP